MIKSNFYFAMETWTNNLTSSEEDCLVSSDDCNKNNKMVPLNDDDIMVLKIFFYSLIFVFAVAGNLLVIVTLTRNRRMRTVTNVFLLNLAISDLLLGVFCMPFTLIGSLLRDFVFGEPMCRMIPYLQAVSVAVSVWTLVSISMERFFAICRPLQSRRWQTVSHAYRVILVIWLTSLLAMAPIAILSQLIPLNQKGKHKCREVFPDIESERAFNIYLDVMLLVLPLLVMTSFYLFIIRKVCQGGQPRSRGGVGVKRQSGSVGSFKFPQDKKEVLVVQEDSSAPSFPSTSSVAKNRCASQTTKQLVFRSKVDGPHVRKRQIALMLCVVVAEFFVCWTPLYVINTMALFQSELVYYYVGQNWISACHLLAYVSSCCNPITYCFLNKQFRKAFINTLGCRRINSPHRSATNKTCTVPRETLQLESCKRSTIRDSSTRAFAKD